jgi:DNA repair exonuclease SbcCD nuclease subunit
MRSKNDLIFTLELRIRKQIIKLNVHEVDSLNDLFLRLEGKVQLKEKQSEILKEKLETELRRMANSATCSLKVRNKL